MLLLKNRLLLIGVLSVLLCASLILWIQADNAAWIRIYKGPESYAAYSLVVTADGGYALAGGPLLVKTDVLGNMEWNHTYDGTIYSLITTSDGGYALAGSAIDDSSEVFVYSTDFWLAKTDALGNVEWSKTYGNPAENVEEARSLVATSDGGYALAGSMSVWSEGEFYPDGSDFWLVKTDSFGNMLWNQTYGGEGTVNMEEARSLVVAPDGGYALAGSAGPLRGFIDFWLVKTDSFGNMLWNQTYGGEDRDWACALVLASDGGYVMAGVTKFDPPSDDGLLVKTDALGNMLWSKRYGGVASDGALSLVATSDGGYAFAGSSQLTGSTDFWLVKTDANGNEEWSETYGNSTDNVEVAYSLVVAPDGGFALAGGGDTGAYDSGDKDFWLVKTEPVLAPSPTPSPSESPIPTATSSPETSPTPESTPTFTPEPTSTPYDEPQLAEQEVILSVAVIVAVIGAGLGLLIYLIKRK
jgi:hypothetical protein